MPRFAHEPAPSGHRPQWLIASDRRFCRLHIDRVKNDPYRDGLGLYFCPRLVKSEPPDGNSFSPKKSRQCFRLSREPSIFLVSHRPAPATGHTKII